MSHSAAPVTPCLASVVPYNSANDRRLIYIEALYFNEHPAGLVIPDMYREVAVVNLYKLKFNAKSFFLK